MSVLGRFDDAVDFIEDAHRVRLDRPVMFSGVIDGRCLITNTELLLKAYDSELLRLILMSDEKRKEEVEDEQVRKEIEKIRELVEAFERDIARLAALRKESSSGCGN